MSKRCCSSRRLYSLLLLPTALLGPLSSATRAASGDSDVGVSSVSLTESLPEQIKQSDSPPSRALFPHEVMYFPTVEVPLSAEQRELKAPRDAVDPHKIGKVIAVESTKANAFTTLTSGSTRLDVLNVRSPGATMVRVLIRWLDMQATGKLFVYPPSDPGDLQIYPLNDGSTEQLRWSAPVVGDTITLEYLTLDNTDSADSQTALPFQIEALAHIYWHPFVDAPTISPTAAPNCSHIEVPSAWASVARAVGGVDFIGGTDALFCSGTLLNNLSGDLTPYLLTADHCGITSTATADTARIWWNYTAGDFPQSTLAHSDRAELIATRDKVEGSDFTLLRLRGTIPRDDVTWAGWTTGMPGLGTAVVGIHHPRGSHRRISFGDIGTGCPGGDCLPNTCSNFLPVDWDNTGNNSVENVSSGSGLWTDSATNPQLVGQLFCGTPCSTVFNSYYGRFDRTYSVVSAAMQGGGDDSLENNDTRSSARLISPNTYSNLVVKFPDEDWYKVDVAAGSRIDATVSFEHDFGDIDTELYRGSSTSPIDTSTSSTDSESVSNQNSGGAIQYFLRVFLHSDTRNEYTLQISVTTSGQPDLVVVNPGASTTTPNVGQAFTISAMVQNNGTATANASTLRYYYSNNSTISTGDTSCGSTDAIPGLAAGGTSAQSGSCTIPASGTYWVGACVDTVANEVSTTNNCSAGVNVTVNAAGQPDLVVVNPDASTTTPNVGQAFTISATVQNNGTATANASTLRYYYSNNSTISTGDTSCGSTDAIPGLAAGGTSTQSGSCTIPASGTYWVGACVDTVANEASTSNNCSAGVNVTVNVAGQPDLVVINPDASTTTPNVGQAFTVSATVQNNGTATADASTLRYYYSNNSTISTGDTSCGSTDAIPGLAAGGTSAQSGSCTISASGTYWVGACVDTVANEGSTSNNCSASVNVTVNAAGQPDLVVINPDASTTTPNVGQAFAVSATVQNNGTATADASTLRYYYSNNSTISTGDTSCGSTDAIPGLTAGGTSAQSGSCTISASGTYWVGACVDTVANEASTSNNCSAGVEVTVGQPGSGADYFTVTPCRAIDTRSSTPLVSGNSTFVQIASAGTCTSIPTTATAVVANVTVTGSSTAGHLTIWYFGTEKPNTSVINYGTGQTRANNAVLRLALDGVGDITVEPSVGTVHLIIDVFGYFAEN